MDESVRDKIISEIILTEKTYLQQLNTLEKYFIKPLLEKEFFPANVHAAIFGELASLQHMNNELYQELASGDGNVGRAFLRLAPFLKVYSAYAKNYQQAMNLILDWERKNEKFRIWLGGTESRPEVQSKLPSLLITPVQRVPRYRLLLVELLKHTSKEHPDYESIAKAEEEVGRVAEHIDQSISKSESLQRVLIIQRALKNGQPNIIAPGRHLLKEGVLQKVSRSGKNYQARIFFLFTDVLLYTKPTVTNLSGSSSCSSLSELLDMDYKPRSLEYCCLLPLRHCSVTCVFGGGKQNLLRLKCESEDLLLFSDKAGEWVAALKEAIQQAVKNRKTLRKESSSRKPIRRPALRKMTLRGNPEQLIPLKVAKSQDENQNNNTPKAVSDSPRVAKETTPKSQWSPGTFFSQLIAQDCLTPPWLSPSRRKRAAKGSSSEDDARNKLKAQQPNLSNAFSKDTPEKSAKRCKLGPQSSVEGNQHRILDGSPRTPRRACPYPPR